MKYGVIVILHGAMGYDAMIMYGAENCTKITLSCDHDMIGTLVDQNRRVHDLP
jgi:hypothetical protein